MGKRNEEDERPPLSAFAHHTLWTTQAGNVKPVTVDDLKDNKPNRAVYSSSALTRVIASKHAANLYEAMEHPSFRHSPTWTNGGTDAFVSEIETMTGTQRVTGHSPPVEFYNLSNSTGIGFSEQAKLAEEERYSGPRTHFKITDEGEYPKPIPNPKGLFFTAPDGRSWDHTIQPEFISLTGKLSCDAVPLPASLSQFDVYFYALQCFLIGFSIENAIQAQIMLSSGVVVMLQGLNPSGFNYTFLVNQVKSIGIRVFVGDVLSPHQPSYIPGNLARFNSMNLELAYHTATGDDQLYAFRVARPHARRDDYDDYLPGHPPRNDSAKAMAGKTARLLHTKLWGTKENPGLFRPLESACGVSWKETTTEVSDNLSTLAYLSVHVVAASPFGNEILTVSRALDKIIHMVLWPHQNLHGSGLTQGVYGALLAEAAYVEGALLFDVIGRITQELFLRFAKGWSKSKIPVIVHNETIDRLASAVFGHVPALKGTDTPVYVRFPSKEKVYELMTGEQPPSPVQGADVSTSGEETPVSTPNYGVEEFGDSESETSTDSGGLMDFADSSEEGI